MNRWLPVAILAAGLAAGYGLFFVALPAMFRAPSEPQPTSTPILIAVPTLPPSPSPVTPTASPTVAPTPTPTLAPLVVAGTGGEGLSLRRAPSAGAERIKVWPEGTLMVATGPQQQAEGRTWKAVRDPDGNEGWVAAEFLAEQGIPPSTPPRAPATPATARPTAATTPAPAAPTAPLPQLRPTFTPAARITPALALTATPAPKPGGATPKPASAPTQSQPEAPKPGPPTPTPRS